MVSDALFSSATGEWETPQPFYDEYDRNWQFTLDAAASHENAKCPHYFTDGGEFRRHPDGTVENLSPKCGLTGSWGSMQTVWLNPPYGNPEQPCARNCEKKKCVKRGACTEVYIPGVKDWVEKAWTERLRNDIVMLLPARTDTRWFHDWIWDGGLNKPQAGITVEFIKGRLTFGGDDNPAPFPSMVVTFADR